MTAEATLSEYSQKPTRYFSGARRSFVDALPALAGGRLLEIGCGNGDTAAYALSSGKCGWATGVELCDEPAREAAGQLNQVIVGDIEQLSLPFREQEFDALIMSEVLEHLRDPWAVLRKLHPFLKPGAVVMAGSPNVAHHAVLRMMLGGGWDYAPMGVMDRTHLRWFTPRTYAQMFEECGYTVDRVGPAIPLRTKARWLNRCTGGRWQHLLHTQISLQARRA